MEGRRAGWESNSGSEGLRARAESGRSGEVACLSCWRTRLASLFLDFLPVEPMVTRRVTRPGSDSF